MKLSYKKAVALLKALKIKADGWSKAKVQERLAVAILKAPEKTELGSSRLDELFDECVEAVTTSEESDGIVIVGGPGVDVIEKEGKKPTKKKKPVKKARRARDEEEEEEEEEKPRRSAKKKSAKAEKKPVKKAKAAKSGTSNKERIFKLWLKTPSSKKVEKWAEMFQEVQKTTIRSWVSGWKNGVGLPGCAAEMKAEVKAAMKKAKAMLRDEE